MDPYVYLNLQLKRQEDAAYATLKRVRGDLGAAAWYRVQLQHRAHPPYGHDVDYQGGTNLAAAMHEALAQFHARNPGSSPRAITDTYVTAHLPGGSVIELPQDYWQPHATAFWQQLSERSKA